MFWYKLIIRYIILELSFVQGPRGRGTGSDSVDDTGLGWTLPSITLSGKGYLDTPDKDKDIYMHYNYSFKEMEVYILKWNNYV